MFGVIDLRLLQDSLNKPDFLKPPNQIWMLYMLECPLHTGKKISSFATLKSMLFEVILKFKILYFHLSHSDLTPVQVVCSSQTSSTGQQPTGRTPPSWLHTRSGSTTIRLSRPGPSRLTTPPAKPRKWLFCLQLWSQVSVSPPFTANWLVHSTN